MSDVVEIGPDAPAPRSRRFAAIGVVLAVLLGGGGVAAWAATRGADGSDGAAGAGGAPLTCPTAVADPARSAGRPLVPELPTASGVDGRLVPERAPTDVLLCAYEPPPFSVDPGPDAPVASDPTAPASSPAVTTPGRSMPNSGAAPEIAPDAAMPLTSSARATGGQDALRPLLATLRSAPLVTNAAGRVCSDIAWNVLYLVGLTYDDGVVWLASPDECSGTTNGVDVAAVDLREAVVTAIGAVGGGSSPGTGGEVPRSAGSGPPASSGPEPVTPEPGSGTTGAPGNPGGDPTDPPFVACLPAGGVADTGGQLVPFTPTSVTVCPEPVVDTPAASTVQDATVAVPLARSLNALLPLTAEACTLQAGPRWGLLFRDDAGAQALVLVDAGGCGTAAAGDRVSQLDADVLAQLSALG